MNSRRLFLQTAALGAAGSAGLLRGEAPPPGASAGSAPAPAERAVWLTHLERVADPVLAGLAAGALKKSMPVECPAGNPAERARVTHLEAVGRLLSGIAPWLALAGKTGREADLGHRFASSALSGLDRITDRASPDFLEFTANPQNLVDAAFLALGLLRAPAVLWEPLPSSAKTRLVEAMKSTRKFKPGNNNWLLFASTVEAWLESVGADWKREPVESALKAHGEWYKGDGSYGDGPSYHWDYYNSFVIHPMLRVTVERLGRHEQLWEAQADVIRQRARRYAAVQERSVAPDGTYPPFGRSLCYRCGAFHHLADTALRRDLPTGIKPAQVRGALGAVIRKTLEAPETYDTRGWLRVGLCGHQPGLAEGYISTGSLYLCANAFLPLGLPPEDEFWSGADVPWTAKSLWAGQDGASDHADK